MIEIKSQKTGDKVNTTLKLDGKERDFGIEAAALIIGLLKHMHKNYPAGAKILSAALKAEMEDVPILNESEANLQ